MGGYASCSTLDEVWQTFHNLIVADITLWEVWSEGREICLLSANQRRFFCTPKEWLLDESFPLEAVKDCETPRGYDTVYDRAKSARVSIAVFGASLTKKKILELHLVSSKRYLVSLGGT